MPKPQPLEAGQIAPPFEFEEHGSTVSSTELDGPYLLYFYPKDNTPGCTTQACGIRDAWNVFTAAGLRVIGVSKDSIASHEKFKAKFELPFPLISDPNNQLAQAYGVFGEKKFMGKTYDAAHRMSFLMDAQGKILKTYSKVKPATHAAEVLNDLSNFTPQA